jgi:CspA family cold shock protein
MESFAQRNRGIVREFDKTRGHGTIEDESGKRIFVRYSAIIGQGIRILKSGDHVSFDLEHTPRGPNAVHVVLD